MILDLKCAYCIGFQGTNGLAGVFLLKERAREGTSGGYISGMREKHFAAIKQSLDPAWASWQFRSHWGVHLSSDPVWILRNTGDGSQNLDAG